MQRGKFLSAGVGRSAIAGSGWLAAMLLARLAVLPGSAAAQALLEATQTHAHPVASAAFLAHLHPEESVEITVALRLRNRDKLDATLHALTERGNPAFRQWLGSRDIERDYAPTASDARAVVAYLTKAGFTHIEVAGNRLLVTAKGGPDAVRRAFHTELAHFARDGREGIANTEDVRVPATLGGRVLAVLGLQTLDRLRPMSVQAAGVQLTGTIHGLDPVAFPIAYDAASLPAASTTTVGIITAGSMTQPIADLHAFESQNGLPTITPTLIIVGAAGTDTSGTSEWDLDSQSIQAMAGGQVKEMRWYVAPTLNNSDIANAINAAVKDNLASVINISLGQCETNAQAAGMVATTDQLFAVALAQGQTFSVSSGDSGSNECGNPAGSAVGAAYPASSPYVIAVGGTSLSTDASGNYVSEVVWNGTGGSPSLVEPKPVWQNGEVVGSFRGVPDIAFDADPNSGAIIVVNGTLQQWGGTSLASPLFVGSWARIQTANKARLGFPATWIYSRGAQATPAFHDVTSGSNGGYTASVGWDYTTGFGSFDVSATAALTRPTVAVSATPGVIVPGQSVTLTATVTGNLPTGTVQFQVNGVNVGGRVTLVNGIARLTTSLLTLVGSDVITAVYSGDSNNAGAASTAGFTETVATAGVDGGGDVPLPPWALALLGGGLMTAMWRQRRGRPRE